ncbi:hypothetical protein H2198_006445 [Neophaeococcomyces mojaviensis]|uniref:Uncharacterized protein n=1 Tax=Neophaeococcomyces mojaviensis TaxID=3383035 RepID=A0ACC3A2W5_9EURO|nr:hypothetical protein H2198_006445 [Knufia sp. JES_112]
MSVGLKCGGYEKNIFFASATANEDDVATRFRRPLFTVKERESMSEWLTSSVPPKKAFKLLSQIDHECENAPFSHDISINHGPFGVFRFGSNQQDTVNGLSQQEPIDISSSDLVFGRSDDYSSQTQLALSVWTQDTFQPTFDQLDFSSLPTFSDTVNAPMDTGYLGQIFGISPIFETQNLPDGSPLFHDLSLSQSFILPHTVRSPTPIMTISSLSNSKNSVPSNALLLLQHYSSIVIGALTPYRHSKTPWHVLFLPYVRQCLAALVLNEGLDHAGICIFFGTLSVSAFSLGASTRSLEWLESAKTYKEQAQKVATTMLKYAYDLPKKAKYKSILMALLTLVHCCIFSDDRERTDYYLLEAEKFIRLRGLKRRKSRKVRLLHHCYVFTRVFHESMSFSSMDMTHRYLVRDAVESSGVVVDGSDTPDFRIKGWKDWHAEMMVLKPQDEGENDLHLERPGFYPATLYPEIFGVPEPWLLLLSQVIRLGNEKDSAEQSDAIGPLELRDFSSRGKAIERAINQLDLTSETDIGSAADSCGNRHGIDPYVRRNMLEAMQAALIIYFYRRIYDIDASMLQPKVRNVRDCLLHNQQADADVPYGSAEFIWPAFVAACEAEDADVRLCFSQWFEHYAQRTGLPNFTSAKELVERVWKEKGNDNCAHVSWLDIMKKDLTSRQRR